MLFIITGLTGEIADRAKALFEAKNISTIKKDEISSPNRKWITPGKTVVDDGRTFDYEYQVNEKTVRLNKSAFLDAVNGKINAVLNITPKTSNIISNIKSVYDVKTIFVYIEEKTLEATIRKKYKGISEEDVQRRLSIGFNLRKEYLKNITLYDDIVVYDDQEHGFGIDDALKQIETIIDKKINEANNGVDLPYKGNKPYTFVSYSHKDSESILPILEKLRQKGCRLWYDEGITVGSVWQNTIANKVANCSQFIVFSSKNSITSKYVLREIELADQLDKRMVRIKMDESKFEMGTEMTFLKVQHLETNAEKFDEKLFEAILDQTVEKDI